MNILIADDQRSLLKTYQALLEAENHQVFTANTIEKAKNIITQDTPIELGIFDFDFGEIENGMDLLLFTRSLRKKIPIILNTSSPNDVETLIGNLSPQDQEQLSPLLICFKMTFETIRETIHEALQKSLKVH